MAEPPRGDASATKGGSSAGDGSAAGDDGPHGLPGLPLDVLRARRRELLHERARVAYWCRRLQARLDALVAAEAADALDGLALLLSGASAGPGPPDRWWDHAADLVSAQCELAVYARVLAGHLDRVTAELVRRYRADPSSCLTVLPALPVARAGTTTGAPARVPPATSPAASPTVRALEASAPVARRVAPAGPRDGPFGDRRTAD